MSMDHDGKLNTTPMIDEEIEQALLDLMDKETPDLWNRIMAGLDAPDAPSGFDDIVGEVDDAGNVPETEADETVGSTFAEADETVGSTFAEADDTVQSGDNVVPFRAKEDKAVDSGSSIKSVKPGRSRAMSRVWGNLIAAAVVLIIISVPVSRLIINQKKNQESNSPAESTMAATEAAAESAVAETYEEDAMAAGADEMMEEEADDDSHYKNGGAAFATDKSDNNAVNEATTQAAYDTESATWAATESATEAEVESLGDDTTAGEYYLGDKKMNIYGITDQKYMNVRKYAGTFNMEISMRSIQDGRADASIEARIVVKDGEYYLTDYIDVTNETENESKEYSEGEIRIVNPDDAGIPQLLEVEGYTEDSRYRFSVKYPEKNNENEVEIVEILSIE